MYSVNTLPTDENSVYDTVHMRKKRICTVIALIVVSVLLCAVIFAILFLKDTYLQKNRNKVEILTNISDDIINSAGIKNASSGSVELDPFVRVYYSPPTGLPADFDYALTENSFAGVTSLSLDMRCNNDLESLKYCKELKQLEITNADLMSDKDVETVSGLGLTSLRLIIDVQNINIFDPLLPDYSRCNCNDVTLQLTNADFTNENKAYALFHVFGKYYPIVRCDGMDYEKYNRIDDKLAYIISAVDLTNCKNDKDKALKYIMAAVKYLYYDEDVSDYSMTHTTLEEGTAMYDLCKYYNDYQLSSILFTDKSTAYGCCTNFTSLYLAICVKMDFECYMVDGRRSAESGFLHDWNYIKADGTYYCVDITETNRWFKRSAGMYYGYYNKFIAGNADIFDDPVFYPAFEKQIFETYNNFIFNTYVFFSDPTECHVTVDRSRNVSFYNEYPLSVTKSYVNVRSAMTYSAVFAIAVTVLFTVAWLITVKIRYRKQ